MIALVTLLTAFPLGFFLRNRLTAVVVYVALYGWAFTFQGVYLMLESLDRQPAPAFEVGDFPGSYGAVTAAIYAVGFGLVLLGHWAGSRRRSRAGSRGRTGPAAVV